MIAAAQLKKDFGTEIAAIIMACRVFVGTASDEELAAFIQAHEIDWQKLYTITRTHQLRPVVYKVLHRFAVPQDIKDKLQKDCRTIALHNLEHVQELTRIYTQLSAAGVQAIPYKGCTFALEYYKDISMREFSDIDFLIMPDTHDLDDIKIAFESSGYIDKSAVPDDFKTTQLKYAREYYFDRYENGSRKFHAEFHWFTASQVFDFPSALPNELLFRNLQERDIYGKPIEILSNTHHFIAIAVHHGLNQRWELIKYIMDLSMIVKNGTPDWVEINTISKKYGFNKAVNIGLHIADDLLGIKPAVLYNAPKDAAHYLHTLLSSLSKERKSTKNVLLLNLRIKDNISGKLKMIGKYMHYATVPSILDYKFLRLPRSLYFLYAIVKPIRLLTSRKKD